MAGCSHFNASNCFFPVLIALPLLVRLSLDPLPTCKIRYSNSPTCS